MARAFFIDRDGIINKVIIRDGKPTSPRKIEEFELAHGIGELLLGLKSKGFLNILITNQPEVPRGLVSKEEVQKMHDFILENLEIDNIQVCFHDNFHNCECRKPQPGLILKVAEEMDINLADSFMLGDTAKDMEAGKRAGCQTIILDAFYNQDVEADFRVKTLREVINILRSDTKVLKKENCRICDGKKLKKVLDLGEMPPANAFLRKENLHHPEDKFPLAIYFCEDCGLLQLLDVVDSEILFGNYEYLTSASSPLVGHFEKMAKDLCKKFIKSKDDLMIEIGGNDGVLLSAAKDQCRVLNIEPAKRIAEISEAKGVPAINHFFDEKLANFILNHYGRAKVVVANNVFAHIDNLEDIFNGIKLLIGEEGVFVFEVHWVGNLISDGGFDQIYHEHLCYFSLIALQNLVEQSGLKIFDVELVPIHGESLRVYVGKNKNIADSVPLFLEKEKNLNLDKVQTFVNFSEKVRNNKTGLLDLLQDLKRKGKRIIGYGAPAKGNTLLNYFEINKDMLDFIIDTTPLKQGLYTPGTHIPIYHPDKIKESMPDYILLLAWNYKDNILEKEKDLRQKGVKFIIPVPEVKII